MTNHIYRLIRRVPYHRAMQLNEFAPLKARFDKLKERYINEQIALIKDASEMHYYMVIEYYNLFDLVDYDALFSGGGASNASINEGVLGLEHEKMMRKIEENTKNSPEAFSKLGITNVVKGCYLVCSLRNDLNNINFKQSKTTTFIRFANEQLPKEIIQMCNEYFAREKEEILRQQEEFSTFIGLNMSEKKTHIEDFNQRLNILTSSLMKAFKKDGDDDATFLYGDFDSRQIRKATMEDVVENHLDNINDIEFLNKLMSLAKEEEKYELCAKLRDKITFLATQEQKV